MISSQRLSPRPLRLIPPSGGPPAGLSLRSSLSRSARFRVSLLSVSAGEPGIEAAAHPVGDLPVGFEFSVQRADQPEGDGAFAAGPSEVFPEEMQGVLGGGRALRLRLVLRERTQAFDFGGAAAKP